MWDIGIALSTLANLGPAAVARLIEALRPHKKPPIAAETAIGVHKPGLGLKPGLARPGRGAGSTFGAHRYQQRSVATGIRQGV